jgi:hypothetical protein
MQVKQHAAPDGIMSQEQGPERAVQMSVHRFKVAAILLLAPSISGIGPTVPASAGEQSVRRGKMADSVLVVSASGFVGNNLA